MLSPSPRTSRRGSTTPPYAPAMAGVKSLSDNLVRMALIALRYPSDCLLCREPMAPGDRAEYVNGQARHPVCIDAAFPIKSGGPTVIVRPTLRDREPWDYTRPRQ